MSVLEIFRISSFVLCSALVIACSSTEKDDPDTTETGSATVDSSDSGIHTGDGETGDPDDTGDIDNDDTGEPSTPSYTIWSGPKTTFTKSNFADPLDPANQDAMTENVILTRGNRGSLINVVLEESANGSSPAGTQWSKGTTADIASLTFDTLKGAADNQMQRIEGESFVLHLIEDDVYLDVTFLSWTSGGTSGGGFSYERSTAE